MDDKKELYEIIGFLFVENRRGQGMSEQLQRMLEDKVKENNLLQEQLRNTNEPKQEV